MIEPLLSKGKTVVIPEMLKFRTNLLFSSSYLVQGPQLYHSWMQGQQENTRKSDSALEQLLWKYLGF